MQRTGVLAATGAITGAVAALTCCLPAGLLGAVGLASVAAGLQLGQPWLLGLSFVFLGVGFAQVMRIKRCGQRPSRLVTVLLSLAAVLVLLAALFPQVIAGWLADWGSWE